MVSIMRKRYLDNVRWITVCLVVIYHVIYIFNGVTEYGVIGPFRDFQPQDVFQYIVYPWFMLLLFVVSGMSARFYLEKHTHKEFIKSRTTKLLVPSTIGVLLAGWILGYYNVLIGGGMAEVVKTPQPIRFIIYCLSGTGVLWYIQLLWVFSIVLVLVRKIEKDRLYNACAKTNIIVLLCLTVVIYGAAQILNTPIVVVYRFGIYGVGFFIGYFLLAHDEVMEKVKKQWILLSVLGIISCIAFVVMYWGKSYADHEVLDTPVCNIFAWIATLGVLAFMGQWGNFENRFSKFMNKNSWGLYVFHYLFIAVCGWYLHLYAPNLAPVVVYLLVTVAAFAGSYVINAIVSRIPVLRWCILGIEKDK